MKQLNSGKKGKKTKGKTVDLASFLGGGPAAPQGDEFTVVTAPKSSWADEMDDYDDSSRFSSRSETIVLPTAPRAARGLDIDESRIPNAPPYTAYVANLPYDVGSEEIMDFFGKLKVRRKLFSSLIEWRFVTFLLLLLHRSPGCDCRATAIPRPAG